MGSGSEYVDVDTAVSQPVDAVELCALVSVDGVVTSHALPPAGEVKIGRAPSCDLVIEHPSVSRHHATLRLEPLEIMDVRSRNGIRLRGAVLAREAVVAIAIGEALQLGHATVLIHHRALVFDDPNDDPPEHSHHSLARQLDVECARSARSGSPFAYLRVHVPEDRETATREHLHAILRASDIVGSDGPGRFEVLLPDTPADHVTIAVDRLIQLLGQRGVVARVASARYPHDGITAEQVFARAWEHLDSDAREPTEMDKVRALVAQVATGDMSVLITGETGVGKELCAAMIHRLSPRASRPFVKLNCSAIAESLIESELFGHERGAFTGATSATPGLLEAGDGGTVFLDEIGELPLSVQAKLLRVLEERVVRRVGASTGRTLDVRFICATNRVLPDEVAAGQFRRDLFYRINGVTVTIPPLRERRAEIAGLARAFAARTRRISMTPPVLSAEIFDVLARHAWPGNIRELRNTIERAVLLAAPGPITPQHVVLDPSPHEAAVTRPMERISAPTLPPPIAATDERSLPSAVADLERQRILDTLVLCGGNQTRAARTLGISRNTLLARLDAYGLPRPRKT
jgi:DNA-binding NtrC family response regulator